MDVKVETDRNYIPTIIYKVGEISVSVDFMWESYIGEAAELSFTFNDSHETLTGRGFFRTMREIAPAIRRAFELARMVGLPVYIEADTQRLKCYKWMFKRIAPEALNMIVWINGFRGD